MFETRVFVRSNRAQMTTNIYNRHGPAALSLDFLNLVLFRHMLGNLNTPVQGDRE